MVISRISSRPCTAWILPLGRVCYIVQFILGARHLDRFNSGVMTGPLGQVTQGVFQRRSSSVGHAHCFLHLESIGIAVKWNAGVFAAHSGQWAVAPNGRETAGCFTLNGGMGVHIPTLSDVSLDRASGLHCHPQAAWTCLPSDASEPTCFPPGCMDFPFWELPCASCKLFAPATRAKSLWGQLLLSQLGLYILLLGRMGNSPVHMRYYNLRGVPSLSATDRWIVRQQTPCLQPSVVQVTST